MAKPLILVSNDDDITSLGIHTLVEIMEEIGEVVIVAPNKPQSGMGHAITIGYPIRLDESDLFPGKVAYECSGTPADCVKLAKHYVLKDRKPDLVVSGINHGSNTSISVLYSGTMSAAIEAALEDLPAIGFSLCDYDAKPDFSHLRDQVKQIALLALEKPFKRGIALNVNFPKKQDEPIKGMKLCRQALARWEERFEERQDPYGRRYFWMNGEFLNNDKETDTDEWAIHHNYTSIVPCFYDLTAYKGLEELKGKWGM